MEVPGRGMQSSGSSAQVMFGHLTCDPEVELNAAVAVKALWHPDIREQVITGTRMGHVSLQLTLTAGRRHRSRDAWQLSAGMSVSEDRGSPQ